MTHRLRIEERVAVSTVSGKGWSIDVDVKELEMSKTDIQSSKTSHELHTVISKSSRGESIAKAGTIVSALMASSCCWLPLALLAFGVSGAGIASTLVAYRPIFIVVTFGFLGAAFYFTYRPKKLISSEGSEDCCSSQQSDLADCCGPDSTRKINLKNFNKAMLWVVTVMAVAVLMFPSYVGAIFKSDGDQTITNEMQRVVVEVEGMTCEGCSTIAEKAIRRVPGVLTAKVDYKTKEAVIGVESGRSIPEDEILTALEEAGYHGKIVKSSNNFE